MIFRIFFPKICNLIPPSPPLLCPLLLGTREYLVLNLFVRIIFIWSEFLLLVFLDKSNFCQNKMKPVGVVEVYATKFSQSRFYWKSRKVWCLFKICTAMNPKNHWVNNFCFNFGFWFLFLLSSYLIETCIFFSVFLLLTKFLHERRWRRHLQ